MHYDTQASLPSTKPLSRAHGRATSNPSHCRTLGPIDGKLEIIRKNPLVPTLIATVDKNSIKDFQNGKYPLRDRGNRLSTLCQLL